MEPKRKAGETGSRPKPKSRAIGATEDQVNSKATIPQRIDRRGTKVEDEAGTGEHDSAGG